jgi:hypothetical protein
MDNITTKVKPIFVIKKSLTTNFYLLYINLSKSIGKPFIPISPFLKWMKTKFK